MTHSLESLLSANPNPFAEAMALGVIRTIGAWLRAAVADGSDLEARSQMLIASHLAGRRPGERDRRRAGPRAWARDRDARPPAARDGARRRPARGPCVLPRRSRDRELALVGIALGVASGAEDGRDRRGRRDRRRRAAPARRRPAADACAARPRRRDAAIVARQRRARRRRDPQLAAPPDAPTRRGDPGLGRRLTAQASRPRGRP